MIEETKTWFFTCDGCGYKELAYGLKKPLQVPFRWTLFEGLHYCCDCAYKRNLRNHPCRDRMFDRVIGGST